MVDVGDHDLRGLLSRSIGYPDPSGLAGTNRWWDGCSDRARPGRPCDQLLKSWCLQGASTEPYGAELRAEGRRTHEIVSDSTPRPRCSNPHRCVSGGRLGDEHALGKQSWRQVHRRPLLLVRRRGRCWSFRICPAVGQRRNRPITARPSPELHNFPGAWV